MSCRKLEQILVFSTALGNHVHRTGRGTVTAVPRAPDSLTRPIAILRSTRPRQWAKNLLVYAAPGAAGMLGQATVLVEATLAFVSLCLVSGATYLWNDTVDREADARHPTKRSRPVAAGQLSPATATGAGVVLALLGLGVALAVDWRLLVVVLAYLALTIAYSAVLKSIVVLDVVTVAAGFVLRALAGGAATGVPISNWFFMVTTFGSLFVVVGKRQGELAEVDGAGTLRPTLDSYTPGYLAFLRTVSAGAMLVAYCLWAFETADIEQISIPLYELTIAPFIVAVLRYALLLDAGHGGAPEDVFLGDRPLQWAVAAWLVTYAAAVLVS